jgi:hypothetical protein
VLCVVEIELRRRLGEREVRRPPPRLRVGAEHRAGEVLERALQMRHRDALVHHEALDLVEHRRVGRVEFIGAVRATRAHDRDRRLLGQHHPRLHRRRVRP